LAPVCDGPSCGFRRQPGSVSAQQGGGTLDLPLGRQLRFRSASFWRPQWEWIDALDQPLVHFKGVGAFKWESRVEIENSASKSPDVLLLVVLGWYLMVLAALDAQSGGG